jgi:insertion element IS1 protein InsB
MWSYVQNKKNQRWLWLDIDHNTRKVVAFVFGKRKHEVFKQLKKLLKPFGLKRYYTDGLQCYAKYLPKKKHRAGKTNTQRIERKNLTLRTRVKRLAGKTICFSKTERMHDIVIALTINIIEFALILDFLRIYRFRTLPKQEVSPQK